MERKNLCFQIHPFAGGYKSIPANEKSGDCGDQKEKVMKKPELKSEQKFENKSELKSELQYEHHSVFKPFLLHF